MLKKDHEAVRALFRAFVEAGSDPAARRAVHRVIRQELQTHSRLEEEVFYPAVMRLRAEPAREAVRDALEEHHIADGLLTELDQLEPEDATYAEKMSALRDAVERHIAEEEGSMFTQARIHLTDERLERLGHDMAALRASLLAPELAGSGPLGAAARA